MNKVKSFLRQFEAFVKGDDSKAKAEKVLRGAYSALQTHIHSLTGDTLGKEDEIDAAKEELQKARLNYGELISNRNTYVENLLKAENRLTAANQAMELHNAKISVLKKHLQQLDEEEDAE